MCTIQWHSEHSQCCATTASVECQTFSSLQGLFLRIKCLNVCKALEPCLVCACTRPKLLQPCLTLCNPQGPVARQAPLSMGFSRQEDWSGLPCPPLKEGMVTHFRIPAGRIPWTEEPCRLQSMGSQRVGTTGLT